MRNDMYKKLMSGFTIVELLIYMGILSFMLLVLSSIFTTILDLQLESEAVSNVDHDSRFILLKLSYDIQRADNFIIPSSLGSASSTMQLFINGITYTYSVQNGALVVDNGTEVTKLNGFDTVTNNINFTRSGNTGGKNAVSVEMEIESITQDESGTKQKNINTLLGTR